MTKTINLNFSWLIRAFVFFIIALFGFILMKIEFVFFRKDTI